MSSPICSPDRADLGQDGNSAQSETLKQCGQDGDPKTKAWDGYCIPKKRKRKGTIDKDRYEDDSASSDPYEDDSSSEEEGEVDDVTYKSPLSLHTRDEPQVDSDDELDAKRFDPLSDETEYMLDKSKAKYAKKYFKLHLSEEKIRSRILEDAPIPGNDFLNPPDVDDYLEDLVADHKSMKFLKMHDSSLKFVQKRVSQCMGPLSKIWDEIDKAHEGSTSSMEIEEVVNLLEKTILMIGQVNVACLYERRLNFLAKILKSTKKAKSMLRENEAKLQDDTVLFGNDFYTTLYRKSKDRKRAREMSRDIARPVIKKPRQSVDQPFRQGPSGEQRKSRGSNFSRGTGRGAITKKQRYVKCKHTNSSRTNVESSEGSLQSPSKHRTFETVKNCSKSYPIRGQTKTFCFKLGKNNKRLNNTGCIKGIQDRVLKNSKSKVCPSHKLLGKRVSDFEYRNSGNVTKKSGRDCRPKERMSKSVHKHFICTPPKRWGVSSHFQSKTTKRVCYLRTLQDGRFSGGQEHDDQERFHVQNRSKGCILLYSDTSDSQEIPQVQLGGSTPTVYKSSIRISSRSSSVHENHETYHSIPAQNGDSANNLSGRHFTSESKQRRVDEGQRFPYLVITQPGVVDKLEEISATAQTNNRISGSESRFNRNECLSTSGQNSEHKNEMSKRYKIRPHYNPRIGKSSWIIECNSRGSNSSLALCQRITNVQNKVSGQRKQLQEQNHTVTRMHNRNFLVDPAIRGLEWQTNNNSRTRFSDRDRCIHNGLGFQLPISTSENGGVHGVL